MKIRIFVFSLLISLIITSCVPIDAILSGQSSQSASQPAAQSASQPASQSASSQKNSNPTNFLSLSEGEKHTKFQITTGKDHPRSVDTNINFTRQDMDYYKRLTDSKQFRREVKCVEARSDDTFSPPILISTLFSPPSDQNRNFQIKLLGGIFGITRIMHDENDQTYRYYWKDDEDLVSINEPAKSITTYPLPFFDGDTVYPLQIMIYQDNESAIAFINGKYLSEKKFRAIPGQIIFNDVQPFSSGMDLTLSNSSILTGKLAWRTKEVLTQSAGVQTSGVNPYADKFDINLSGGINQSKERRGKNANEVAEAQVNYQTIDVNVTITPRPDSGLSYPAYVTVTYSYSYTEQWEINHYIWGNINREFERKDSVNRQYLLESPSSVIEDTYTVEYAESVVSSDFTETTKLKLKSDPVINIDVTGVALDPK